MKNAALHGGGKYFDTTSTTSLQDALARVLAEIQAVNSVFVSATLPVALNISNTYLNQVYMGLFRPDANVSPRWFGNLKEYKLAYDADEPGSPLVDRNNNDVVSAKTGFIVPTAVEPLDAQSVQRGAMVGRFGRLLEEFHARDADPDRDGLARWRSRRKRRRRAGHARSLSHQCTAHRGGGAPATAWCSPAGSDLAPASRLLGRPRQVRPGRHQRGQRLMPGQVRREHYGRHAEPCQLGSRHRQQRRRVRPGQTSTGYDVTVRGSAHGDVLHSRPQIVYYGGSTGIVAYYGGNDGMLHAVCAGTSSGYAPAAGPPGEEMWSFVADYVRQVQAPARPDAGGVDAKHRPHRCLAGAAAPRLFLRRRHRRSTVRRAAPSSTPPRGAAATSSTPST